jgi:hypothetical protein
MSRRGKKLTKTEKRSHRLDKDAQELDALVKDTAAAFRSSHEVVEDSATECDRRRADLEADLQYRRLAYEIWRGRPGAAPIASAMADLIAENERHLVAIKQLCRRFDELSKNPMCQEDLGPDVVPEDLIRRRLFSDPPT